ncbi:trichohyalin-like [Coccinella septempunctata]|uniref:trichohyalin-like n=1 Tax=Coccinella septempunctata TaxID=41139 RepID=UPI001D06A351|nr:trichohyalin-like [Coccinella septempunctata]
MLCEGGICILPRTKWDSITNRLTEGERKQEKLEREKAYLKYLKEMSTQLVAGTHTKREAAAKRLEEKQKDGERREKIILEDYLRMRENQKKEREEMLKKYVREAVVHRSPTLELTRALREAQVLEERRKELELKQKIRENEEKMEQREINQLKRQWEASDKFHYEKEENRRCKLDQLKTEVWKQYQDIRERKQKEHIELVDEERMNLFRMAEELEKKERVKKEQVIILNCYLTLKWDLGLNDDFNGYYIAIFEIF